MPQTQYASTACQDNACKYRAQHKVWVIQGELDILPCARQCEFCGKKTANASRLRHHVNHAHVRNPQKPTHLEDRSRLDISVTKRDGATNRSVVVFQDEEISLFKSNPIPILTSRNLNTQTSPIAYRPSSRKPSRPLTSDAESSLGRLLEVLTSSQQQPTLEEEGFRSTQIDDSPTISLISIDDYNSTASAHESQSASKPAQIKVGNQRCGACKKNKSKTCDPSNSWCRRSLAPQKRIQKR